MRELVVISGKGGTGKTSVVASFAALGGGNTMADCDVDAADLHLVLAPEIRETHEFRAGMVASIRQDACSGCGECRSLCRFGAIEVLPGPEASDHGFFAIDPIACEGCGVCAHFCPENAIDMSETVCGEWYVSDTRHGPMVHARLGVAQENSGKLVSVVRGKAKEIANAANSELVLIDGSPGIGCPVIASITGADLALVVTEPTLSAVHDMIRVLKVAEGLCVQRAVCINKWDLNLETSHRIEEWCGREKIDIAGLVPYDPAITESQIAGVSVVEHSDGAASAAITGVWERVHELVVG